MAHQISIPEHITQMATAMHGGRLHIFDNVTADRTALVVIDMQNGYLEPGRPLEVPMAREIVPNINMIAAALRRARGPVIFIQYTMHDEALENWSVWHRIFNTPSALNAVRTDFARGAHPWKLWSKLDVRSEDVRLEKQRFSAMTPGTCDLLQTLCDRNIDTVIITGTMTNVCCEATARDAMQHNFKVVFAADATAAFDDNAHNGTLTNMRMICADVMSSQEIVDILAPAAV